MCHSAGPSGGAIFSSKEEGRFLISPSTWNTFIEVLAANSCSPVVMSDLQRDGTPETEGAHTYLGFSKYVP